MNQITYSIRPLPLAVAIAFSIAAGLAPAAETPGDIDPAPAQVADTQTQAIADDWWQRFDDPLMVDLIGEALAANPDLRSAQSSLRAARAQGAIAGAALQPELSGSSSVSRNDNQSRYGAGLGASWEVDLFGGNRDSARAAGEDILASTANLQDAQISLAAEVASSYISLRRAQAQADILERNLAAQRETAELIEARYKVGLDSELELTQTRLSLGQLLVQLPEQERAVSQSMHALAILSGVEPGALNASLQRPAGVPYVAEPLAANSEIAADLVRRRPDLRAAEHGVAAAGYRRDAAEAARYPSFRLGGGLDFSSLDAADLFDSASMARSLLGSISVPIFNGGRLKQQVSVRDAQYDQAVNSYQKTLLAALAEVADAFAMLDSSERRIPQLTENLDLARDTQLLAFSRYQAGAVNFQTVLDAQRQVLSAEQSLLQVRAENSLAAIDLYRALGGRW